MKRRESWVCLPFAVLVACSVATERAPRCTAGATVACACARGGVGVQSCSADGTLDPCDCSMSARCEPGALFACACEGGARGAQTCNASGTFDPCVCGMPTTNTCVPGTAAACACASGAMGAQVCTAEGVFGACACEVAPERCVPGATQACPCSDGWSSVQTCSDEGRYLPCECGFLDAQIPDAGADAAPPICDPYLGQTCGCPEVIPPASPTLPRPAAGRVAAGSETLVDVFATESGIAVVLRTGVRLLSRAGTELARWDAPREVRVAAFDGARLAVVDPSTITVLGLDLVEGVHVALTADCTAAALISCGRLVCAGSSSGGAMGELGLYDLIGARQLSSAGFGGGTSALRRVPGVDAVVAGQYDSFLIADDANRLLTTGSTFALDVRAIGFHGSPARHMITSDGRMYRLDACTVPLTYDPHCFEREGSIGTLRTGESILAMERGADERLYALVTPTAPTYPNIVCNTGCSVQRVDVDAHVIESAGSIVLATPTIADAVRLRHDPWAGRVLLGLPGTCSSSYPYTCSGWSVAIAAYD
ncbi:MAG: hypothetical protein U0234_09680 [Sandaracinus sp.]